MARTAAGLLQLWNLKSGSIRKDGTMHRGAVRVLEWSPDGEKLVSADIVRGGGQTRS